MNASSHHQPRTDQLLGRDIAGHDDRPDDPRRAHHDQHGPIRSQRSRQPDHRRGYPTVGPPMQRRSHLGIPKQHHDQASARMLQATGRVERFEDRS